MSRTSAALNQIELDLLRTLPNNYHYHNPDDKGVCPIHCSCLPSCHGDKIDYNVEESIGSIQLV